MLPKVQEEKTPQLKSQLSGLHWKDQKEDRRDFFKRWEDREKGGRLRDIFEWKNVNKQEKPVPLAAVEGENVSASHMEGAKSAKRKAGKLDTKCREEVDEIVLKVLQRRKRDQSKKRNKEAVIETKKTVWRGVRDVVSEIPVASKSKKRSEKKRRFAEVRYFSQICGNCEAVLMFDPTHI